MSGGIPFIYKVTLVASPSLLNDGMWRTAWNRRSVQASGAEPSAGSSGECMAGREGCVGFWAGLSTSASAKTLEMNANQASWET